MERQAESDPLCRVIGVRGWGEMLVNPALSKFAFHGAQVMLYQNRPIIFKFGKYGMIHSMGILWRFPMQLAHESIFEVLQIKKQNKTKIFNIVTCSIPQTYLMPMSSWGISVHTIHLVCRQWEPVEVSEGA